MSVLTVTFRSMWSWTFCLIGVIGRLLRSLKFILALFRSDQDRSNVSKYTNNENYNFIRVIQSKREVPKCFMPTRPMVGINIINTILNSISGQDYSIPGGDKTPVERQHHPETEARQDSQSDQDWTFFLAFSFFLVVFKRVVTKRRYRNVVSVFIVSSTTTTNCQERNPTSSRRHINNNNDDAGWFRQFVEPSFVESFTANDVDVVKKWRRRLRDSTIHSISGQ